MNLEITFTLAPRRDDYGPTTGKRIDVLRADYAFAKACGLSAGMLLLVQREIATIERCYHENV